MQSARIVVSFDASAVRTKFSITALFKWIRHPYDNTGKECWKSPIGTATAWTLHPLKHQTNSVRTRIASIKIARKKQARGSSIKLRIDLKPFPLH